eukprot:TRINITY_DN979_c0_g1_i1.p1 TRINITY_DN979_c0_g1~~TRINITY_DN979_c0_g1_i1.p1  ORF type:complete len:434 (-),score=107.65 TRINITY_DN979_c0_g1_i1:18-1319(-)
MTQKGCLVGASIMLLMACGLLLLVATTVVSAQGSTTFQRNQLVESDFEDEFFDDDLIDEPKKAGSSQSHAETTTTTTSATPPQEIETEDDTEDAESQPTKEEPTKAPDTASHVKTLGFVPDRTYYLELGYAVVLVIYFLFYWQGRRQNEIVVKTWGAQYQRLFRENFSKVGDSAMMTKESPNEFRLVATGRRNCVGLEASIKLRCRHDLFTSLYYLVSPTDDLATFEVALRPDKMQPYTLVVASKRAERGLLAQFPEIKEQTIAVNHNIDELAKVPLGVWTDCPEAVQLALTRDVALTIAKYSNLFVSLYVTDQSKNSTYKKLLRVTYRIPPKEEIEQLDTLMRMLFYFIDSLPKIKLPPSAKARAEKRRNQLMLEARKAKQAAQQEKAQAKKQEKLAEQKKVMTDEQRAKLEQKERRRALKKRQGKAKIMFA